MWEDVTVDRMYMILALFDGHSTEEHTWIMPYKEPAASHSTYF
jgi:hypothetical protein